MKPQWLVSFTSTEVQCVVWKNKIFTGIGSNMSGITIRLQLKTE